jgi:RNA polymerase sigma-70 factor, ECF subfamily
LENIEKNAGLPLDEVGFKKLYYEYYEALFKFLWRKTRDYDTSKDLVQELFLRVWKNRENINYNESVKSYLFTSANNLAIDHLRKKITNQKYFERSEINDVPSEQNDYSELKENLDKVLEKMPEKLREVFTLNRFEDLKYLEIAKMLGISVKTVESRMSKALKILRKHFVSFLVIIIFFLLKR